MVRWGLLVLLCAFGLCVQAEPGTAQEIRVAAEDWEGHSQADGTGLAWDLLHQVFDPEGIQLVSLSVPYTRSIGLVQRGDADAWVGAYLDEVEHGVVYPRWHYALDEVYALGMAEQPRPSLNTLGDYRLVWMHGYKYQRYLPNARRYREIQRRSGVLDMLRQGRADFYIDALPELEAVYHAAAEPARYRMTKLTNLPMYLGFADNPRGRALALLYDQRMDVLVKNGSLRPLFARWQQPYPFD